MSRKFLIGAIIIGALVGYATFRFGQQGSLEGIVPKSDTTITPVSTEGDSSPSGYKAVFLSNGQVYFGKLEGWPGAKPKLTDVYYLRLRTPLQQQQIAEGEEATPPAQPQRELVLIKLGSELHGPLDEININPDHILFVENLKENSKVVEAIRTYQTQQAEQ